MSAPTLPTALLLNGRAFAYEAIAQYPALAPTELNGYEARVLERVREWLTGVQEFELTTSGSTGPPAPLRLRRRQMEASAARTGDFFGLGPGDRVLVCLNCEYIGGLMLLVRGLERRMHLTVVEPHANPFDYVAADAAFDFTALVPLQLRAVLAAGQAPRLNALRAVLIGGAPVEAGLHTALQAALTVPVWHTYGMSETCSHVALRRLNGPDATDYYRVLPGIAAGQDARGCLTLRGDVTDDVLITTNDLVELLPAQHGFRWLGRADFVINSGGVKVAAEKVEMVLGVALAEAGHPRSCFVTGRPDERLGQTVAAYLEGPALPAAALAAVQALLAARLGPYEQPRHWVTVPAFATTASGKLDRRATQAAAGA